MFLLCAQKNCLPRSTLHVITTGPIRSRELIFDCIEIVEKPKIVCGVFPAAYDYCMYATIDNRLARDPVYNPPCTRVTNDYESALDDHKTV